MKKKICFHLSQSLSWFRVGVTYLTLLCFIHHHILWSIPPEIVIETLRTPHVRSYTSPSFLDKAQLAIVETPSVQEGVGHNLFVDFSLFEESGVVFKVPPQTHTLYNRIQSDDPIYLGGMLQTEYSLSLIFSNPGGIVLNQALCQGVSDLSLLGGEILKTSKGFGCSVTNGHVSLQGEGIMDEDMKSFSLRGRGIQIIHSLLSPSEKISIHMGPGLHVLDDTGEKFYPYHTEDETLSPPPLPVSFFLDPLSTLKSKTILIQTYEEKVPLYVNGLLQSTEKDIIIHAAGDIYLNHATSLRHIILRTMGKIYLEGSLLAGGDISIEADQGIVLTKQTLLESQGSLDFKARRGGILNEGKILSNKDLTFHSKTWNKGTLITKGTLRTPSTFDNEKKGHITVGSLSHPLGLLLTNEGSLWVDHSLSLRLDQPIILKGKLSVAKQLVIEGVKQTLTLEKGGLLEAFQGCFFKDFGTFLNRGVLRAQGVGLEGKLNTLQNEGKIDLSQAYFETGTLKNVTPSPRDQKERGIIRTHGHFSHRGNSLDNRGTFLTLGLHEHSLTGTYKDSGRVYTPTFLLLNAFSINYTDRHSSFLRRGVLFSDTFMAGKTTQFFLNDFSQRPCSFHISTKNDLSFNGTLHNISQNSRSSSMRRASHQHSSSPLSESLYESFFWTGEKRPPEKDFQTYINSLLPTRGALYERLKPFLRSPESNIIFEAGRNIICQSLQTNLDSQGIHFSAQGQMTLSRSQLITGFFKDNHLVIEGKSGLLKESDFRSFSGSTCVFMKDVLSTHTSHLRGSSYLNVQADYLDSKKSSFSSHSTAHLQGAQGMNLSTTHIKGKEEVMISGGGLSLKEINLQSEGVGSIIGTDKVDIQKSRLTPKDKLIIQGKEITSSYNHLESFFNHMMANTIVSSHDSFKGETDCQAHQALLLKDFTHGGSMKALAPHITLEGENHVTHDLSCQGETIALKGNSHVGQTASLRASHSFDDSFATTSAKKIHVFAPTTQGIQGHYKAEEEAFFDLKSMAPEDTLLSFLGHINAPIIKARLQEAHIHLEDDLVINSTLHLWAKSFENRAKLFVQGDFLVHLQHHLLNQGHMDIRGHGSLRADTVMNTGTIETGDDLYVEGHRVQIKREVKRHTGSTGYYETAQQEAAFKAGKDMKIEATDTLISQGGSFHAKGSVTLQSKGYLHLGPQVLHSETSLSGKNFSYYAYSRKNLKTAVTAGQDIKLSSHTMLLEGIDFVAQHDIDLRALADLKILAVYDQIEESFSCTSKGGVFKRKKTVSHQKASKSPQANSLKAKHTITIISDQGDITLQKVHGHSDKKTYVEASEGHIHFSVAQSEEKMSTQKSSSNLVWQSQSSYGHFHQNSSHNLFFTGEGFEAKARQGIRIDHGQDLDLLEHQPGMTWLKELRQNPQVTFSRIHDAHMTWHHKSQGLTGPAASLIHLAIGMAMCGGAGTALLSGITPHASLAAMTKAGLIKLIGQASVSLINHQGDLKHTLKDLSSSKNVRSLVASMLTAGLHEKVCDVLNIPATPNGILEHFQKSALSSASTAISMGIQGHSLKDICDHVLRSTVAHTMGSYFAHQIGSAYEAGDISGISHKLLHAASGALGAKLLDQDMTAGALGAVIAETLAEQVIGKAPQLMEKLLDENPSLSHEAILELYETNIRQSLDIIKLETGAIVLLMDYDVTAATTQASQALEHNCVSLLLKIGTKALQFIKGLQAGARVAKGSVTKATARYRAKQVLKELVKNKLPDNLKKGTWTPSANALKKVPSELGKAAANKSGIGYRWVGRKGSNGVRIDKGNPNAKYSHERVDHVRINVNGKMMSWDGKVLPAGTLKNTPEVHIPLSEWLEWTAWNIK